MMANAIDEPGFRALTEKIARDRGFGCANYKDGCLRRRIAVRMRACGTADFASYVARLDHDPNEYEHLLDALTINVTKLFRDIDVWTSVAQTVIPALWALDVPRLNVWSAGCASGEEPYTLSLLLHEMMPDVAKRDVRILHIHELILVERVGQKKIIVGDKGERIKRIGQEARKDMEVMFDSKIMLNLWVKVKSGWSDDERALRSLGYDNI